MVVGVDITTVLLFVLAFLICRCFYIRSTHYQGLPPSPGFALPFLGHLYMMKQDPRHQFLNWAKQLGPLYTVMFGNEPHVFLSGPDLIRTAFLKNIDAFTDRPQAFLMETIGRNKGFLTTSSHWKEQRKVSLEIFKSLGFGTFGMEEKLQGMLSGFLNKLTNTGEEAINPSEMIFETSTDLISLLMFGPNFKSENDTVSRCARLIGEQVSIVETSGKMLNIFPSLRFIPGDIFGFHRVMQITTVLSDQLIKPEIEKRKLNLKQTSSQDIKKENIDLIDGEQEAVRNSKDSLNDIDAESVDFITEYLKQIQKFRNAPDVHIDEENLAMMVVNLFAAGTTTTSTTLVLVILYLLNHPDVETKCHQQIMNTIGDQRQPESRDRLHLPYIEATILEVQRIASIVPLVIRSATKDIKLKGYHLTKGTAVVALMDSVNWSEDLWLDPFVFRPERFLNDAKDTVMRKEESLPFFIGKRSCLAENMARLELFLFTTAMIQNFKLEIPPGKQKPDTGSEFGLICSPKPFSVCFKKRQMLQ